MSSESLPTLIGDTERHGCLLCGALIAEDGQQRHVAWHEFLESGITALTAYVATLEEPPA